MSNTQLTPIYTKVPRFTAGSKESLEHLESEGFVVIKGALSPTEAKHALGLTWDYLEHLGTLTATTLQPGAMNAGQSSPLAALYRVWASDTVRPNGSHVPDRRSKRPSPQFGKTMIFFPALTAWHFGGQPI